MKLVYCEEYDRVDEAFYREKQVQGWRRAKREALINGTPELICWFRYALRKTAQGYTSTSSVRRSTNGVHL